MSSKSLRSLNLPAVPVNLKHLSAYLQRADEVKAQEPIIAYWCSYYAAQLGVATKTNDPAVRDFLLSLLAFLETIKKDIGPNDAIDNNVASAAYVENFALKIFGMADNEDRSGNATRATARKFLAAANFLELLKIFDDAEVLESTGDKIRYAKWKAADIAKAFREGRTPTPGPADLSEPDAYAPEMPSPVGGSIKVSPPSSLSLTSEHKMSSEETPQYSPELIVTSGTQRPADSSTPGTYTFRPFQDITESDPSTGLVIPRRAQVSDELEGDTDDSGMTRPDEFRSRNDLYVSLRDEPSRPAFTPAHADDTLPSSSALSVESHPQFENPVVPRIYSIPAPLPPSSPRSNRIQSSQPLHYDPPPPPPGPEVNPEMTPQRIAKAQKHCKFAISALDYEDIAQARKELKEALKILGD